MNENKHTMRRRLVIIIGLFLLISALSQVVVPVVAQVNISSMQPQSPNGELTQIEKIDSNADLIAIKQMNERELRDRLKSLEAEKGKLNTQIIDLSKRKDELSAAIQELERVKKERAVATPITSGDIQVVQNLDPQINLKQKELLEVESELAIRQAKLRAVINAISAVQVALDERTIDVRQEVTTLQTQIIALMQRYVMYVLLVIAYFISLQLATQAIDRFIKHDIARDVIKFIVSAVTVVATIITVLFAFVGNLTYLLTGLGVISAALVVALQDFVSSFFAFIWIKFKGIYKLRDVVLIDSQSHRVIGMVTNIGLFRTLIREMNAISELNAEQPTGRVVSVPNNVVLRTPITNYTQDNRLIWHNVSLTITFESDFEVAHTLLKGILHRQFQYALDHKDQLLDEAYNLKYVYEPKVYMSIGQLGPTFMIWFAVRYGKYQEVLEHISKEILNSFNLHGIKLAYHTTRVVRDEDVRGPGLSLYPLSDTERIG